MRLKLKFLDKPDTGNQDEWFAWFPVVTECNTLVWLEKVKFENTTEIYDYDNGYGHKSKISRLCIKFYLKENN